MKLSEAIERGLTKFPHVIQCYGELLEGNNQCPSACAAGMAVLGLGMGTFEEIKAKYRAVPTEIRAFLVEKGVEDIDVSLDAVATSGKRDALEDVFEWNDEDACPFEVVIARLKAKGT